MNPRERTNFIEWSASIGMSRPATLELLKHLPDESTLDPALPAWVSSPFYVRDANEGHGLGIEQKLHQHGLLVVGNCPNGDIVLVNFHDPQLPVFYLSHEELHEKPFLEIMRKVSGSLAAFSKALSDENSHIPSDYWDDRCG